METTSKIGKRGAVIIPKRMRDRLGLDEGSLIIFRESRGGILIQPAVALPVENYSAQRRAELLLNNAIDADDYAHAVAEVKKMGLDPKKITHTPPPDVQSKRNSAA